MSKENPNHFHRTLSRIRHSRSSNNLEIEESPEITKFREREKQLRNAKLEAVKTGGVLLADLAVTGGLIVASTEYKLPPEAALCAMSVGAISITGLVITLAHDMNEVDKLKY
ncbi:MAG: hypothetical protein ACFFD1_16125 [Candidatus Thorarchaeota archaeon]